MGDGFRLMRESLSAAAARWAVAAMGAALLSACAGATRAAPGEVFVVVTTDMAVPADIDALRWTVTVAGQTTPLKTEPLTLDAESLPGTLAVVSGPETQGPVLVALDALHDGTVRVHREAQFTVPTQGSKALPMALDWLCSNAHPVGPCPAGQTCVAGACAPSAIDAAALPDYTPIDAGTCFDTADCLVNTRLTRETVPQRDDTGRCVLGEDKWPIAADPALLNVALVVDTSVSGSYGACAPGGACLVPLAADTPDGWEPIEDDGGGIIGMVLPDRVCDLGLGVQISAVCLPKDVDTRLCVVPPTCAHSDVTCPSDWQPYSCATSPDGAVAPTDVDPTATDCWPALEPLADGGPGPASSLLCCHPGPELSTDPLLIDDMTGEPQIKRAPPPSAQVGFWFLSTDDLTSVLLPGRRQFEYTALAPPATNPDGGAIGNAACFGTAEAGLMGGYLLGGFDFGNVGGTAVPIDLSSYTGVRFLAWSEFAGQEVRVQFPDRDTSTELPGATCLVAQGSSACGNHFGKNLVLTDTPTEYVVQWSEITQDTGYAGSFMVPTGFDETSVVDVDFLVASYDSTGAPVPYPLPIRICVDDVYFTQ
jgi:hypothetical protein